MTNFVGAVRVVIANRFQVEKKYVRFTGASDRNYFLHVLGDPEEFEVWLIGNQIG